MSNGFQFQQEILVEPNCSISSWFEDFGKVLKKTAWDERQIVLLWIYLHSIMVQFPWSILKSAGFYSNKLSSMLRLQHHMPSNRKRTQWIIHRTLFVHRFLATALFRKHKQNHTLDTVDSLYWIENIFFQKQSLNKKAFNKTRGPVVRYNSY